MIIKGNIFVDKVQKLQQVVKTNELVLIFVKDFQYNNLQPKVIRYNNMPDKNV